jgi:hypothetical protein
MTLQNDVESEVDGNLNEFYYDTLIENHEITFGKKVMAWGVGNNFRPLDVIQNENRRRLFLRSLTGVELVAWDYFLDTGAFTLAYINPVDDEENDSLNEEADSLNEKSLAMKYYHMGENSDQHVVARFSSGNSKRVELGAGFDHIVTDSFKWYGSFLYQRRYYKWLNRLTEPGSELLAEGDPMQRQLFKDGINAMLGFSWTHSSSGISLLGEAWFDNSGYSEEQWDALRQLTQSQRNLLETGAVPKEAVYGNVRASSRFLTQRNLLQQNLMLQISHEGELFNTRFNSSLNGLYTPQDDGWVLTASVSHKRNIQEFELGLRAFGGPADSVYRALPDGLIAYFTWKLAFDIKTIKSIGRKFWGGE